MGRPKNVASRTDSRIEDDEAGAARVRMAAESEERKHAEEEERRQQNSAFSKKLAEGPSRTDSNIDDDPAGIARKEFAAASEARLATERAERRRHKQEMERRIRKTPPRTDNMMDTEAAAIARKVLADKSRAQKAAADAERRRKNAELRNIIEMTPPRTDDCIDDEAAGARRHELAQASARQRDRDREQRIFWNEHLKERVREATDEDGCDEQKQAFQALVAKQELEKGSDVSAATWVTFQRYMQNMFVANESRDARQKRDHRRQDLRNQWLIYGNHLSTRRAEQQMINREVQEEMHQYNRDDSERVRQEEAMRQQVRDAEHRAYMDAARERVRIARSLDDKLDAQEEAQDALERMEGSQMRFEIAEDLKTVREGGLALRRQQAAELKEQTRQAVLESTEQRNRNHAARASEKRAEAKRWNLQRNQHEDEYLRNARAAKADAEATRKKIKQSAKALVKRRQQNAQRIRDEVDLDFETALQNIRDRKAFVGAAYSSKFVDDDSAEQYRSSGLHKLHSQAMKVMENVFPFFKTGGKDQPAPATEAPEIQPGNLLERERSRRLTDELEAAAPASAAPAEERERVDA